MLTTDCRRQRCLLRWFSRTATAISTAHGGDAVWFLDIRVGLAAALRIDSKVGAFELSSPRSLDRWKFNSWSTELTRRMNYVGFCLHSVVHSALITLTTSSRVAFFNNGVSQHFLAVYFGLPYRRDLTTFLYGDRTMNFLTALPFFQWVT